PDAVKEKALKEAGRLEKTPQASPETGVTPTYVDWLASLPGTKAASADSDKQPPGTNLDADHVAPPTVNDGNLEDTAMRRRAPRPYGDHPTPRLHGGREDAHREGLPPAEAAEAARSRGRQARDGRRHAPPAHPRVHARGRRPQPRAGDRDDQPQGRASDRRGQGADARGQARGPPDVLR